MLKNVIKISNSLRSSEQANLRQSEHFSTLAARTAVDIAEMYHSTESISFATSRCMFKVLFIFHASYYLPCFPVDFDVSCVLNFHFHPSDGGFS